MEAVTWSFAGARLCHLFGANPDDARVSLANPIAADLDQMRPSALIHLLLAAGRNADRGYRDLALFEAGPIYLGDGEGDQRSVIAGVTRGNIRHWMGAVAPDVYTVKADVLAILEAMGVPTNSLQISQGARDWWHSGRAGTIKMGPKNVIAEFGEIHPRILKAMDLDGPILAFELFVSDLPPAKPKASKAKPKLDLSPLMPLTRDFACVVAADKPAADLVRVIAGVDKALIKDVRVFDRYQGQGIAPDMVSLAFQVTLAPRDKTLTDADIETLSTNIIASLEKQGARLR
jgi:phenylalanyl-tRNA synthetase beta chain